MESAGLTPVVDKPPRAVHDRYDRLASQIRPPRPLAPRASAHLFSTRSRHPKIRLTEPEGSPAFFARIAELIRETELGPIETKTKPPSLVAEAGTLGHLTQTYMASPAFEDYDAATVRKRRHLFKTMLQEPIAPESDKIFRNFPMARLTTDDLEALRDRAKKAGTIGQANERVKAWRALFKWACAQRPPLATMNVAAAISLIRVPTEGWHTWSLDEIEQFERRHPPGTRAHLAMMILLYTGARRSDVVRLGRPMRAAERCAGTSIRAAGGIRPSSRSTYSRPLPMPCPGATWEM